MWIFNMYVLISQLLINFFFQFRPKGIDYNFNFKNPNNNHVIEFIKDQLEKLINQFSYKFLNLHKYMGQYEIY